MLLTVFFSLLGKTTITAVTCAICYYVIENVQPFKQEVVLPWVPTLAIVFLTYTIGSLFVSLYTDSSKAIILTYLATCEAGSDQNCP